MMIFVDTTCRRAVRLAAVRELRPASDGESVVLSLEGGGERTTTWNQLKAAQSKAMLHMVAAQPGTYVLHVDPNGELMLREPVIAWAVTNMGFVYPVTSGGFRSELGENPLIQHPDGTVQDVLGIHASYEAWQHDLRAEYSRDVDTAEAATRPFH